MDEEECIEIGSLVRFNKRGALFWAGSTNLGNVELPDYAQCTWAEDVYTEEDENPLAIVLGTDFTGTYVHVLWGEKLGWVRSISIESL